MKMKKIACYFLFLLAVQSFAQVRISGTIKNSSTKEVTINGLNRFPIKKTQLEGEKFTIELPIKQGYYSLEIGDESSTIYLQEGDDLSISVDYTNYESTLKFKGKGAEANRYLHQKGIINGKETEDFKTFFASNPLSYKKNIVSLIDKLTKELDKYKVSEDFQKHEITNIRYEYLFYICKYAQFQDFYFEKTVEQPQEFVQEFVDFNYDDEASYTLYPYYRYIAEKKWEDEIAEKATFFSMRIKFDEIKTPGLRMMVFLDCFYKIGKDEEKAESYYKLIKGVSVSDEFTEMARLEYEKVENLQKGKPAPSFEYEDVDVGSFNEIYNYGRETLTEADNDAISDYLIKVGDGSVV